MVKGRCALILLVLIYAVSSITSAQTHSATGGLLDNDPADRPYVIVLFFMILAAEFYLLMRLMLSEKMKQKISMVCFSCGYTVDPIQAIKSNICPDCKRKTTWIELDKN